MSAKTGRHHSREGRDDVRHIIVTGGGGNCPVVRQGGKWSCVRCKAALPPRVAKIGWAFAWGWLFPAPSPRSTDVGATWDALLAQNMGRFA